MKRMLIDFRILLAIVAAAILAAALLVLANPVEAQTTPTGLGGEELNSSNPIITSCNVNEEEGGTFTYQVSGVASGPYIGTFTETGTVSVGPAGLSLRQRITALSAQFTINSSNGEVVVSGTKQYVPTGDPNLNAANGRCTDYYGLTSGTAFVYKDDLRYEATISTPDGQTCTQQGPSALTLIQGLSSMPDQFNEQYYNDLSNPTPICTGGGGSGSSPPAVPTTKEQCKEAGFEDFTALGFKNQGECVAFVERGPRTQ